MERDSCRDFASCVDLVPIFAFLSAEEKQEKSAPWRRIGFTRKAGSSIPPARPGRDFISFTRGK